MKKALKQFGFFLVMSAGVVMGMPPHALAFTFTDLISFATPDRGYTTVSYGTNQSSGFSWQHSLLKHLGALAVSDVEVLGLKAVITYSQTHSAESWAIDGVSNLSSVSAMTQSEFILGQNFIDDLSLDGILNLAVSEGTPGIDSFRLFSSKLSGDYQLKPKRENAQIPEPGTAILLLAGLGMLRLRKLG